MAILRPKLLFLHYRQSWRSCFAGLAHKTASSLAWQEFEQSTFLLVATGEMWFVKLQLKKGALPLSFPAGTPVLTLPCHDMQHKI